MTRAGCSEVELPVGHPANRCQVCHEQPSWDLRRQDAVVTWACGPHLVDVLIDLQRLDRQEAIAVTFIWEAR